MKGLKINTFNNNINNINQPNTSKEKRSSMFIKSNEKQKKTDNTQESK